MKNILNKLEKISWEDFEGPYQDSKETVKKYIFLISDVSINQEEFEYILYNELLPNIKHQYTIYNIIFPVLQAFDILTDNNNYKFKMIF